MASLRKNSQIITKCHYLTTNIVKFRLKNLHIIYFESKFAF